MYKLLIVDDEAIERRALKYIIGKSTIEFEAIEEATNGQEAIAVAAIFEPDIIIMDIKMPGLDGLEATKIIKKIRIETRIILLTAFDEFNHAHAGIRLGVEDFVVKPASDERIISVLDKAIHELTIEKEQKEKREKMEDKLIQVSKYLETEFMNSLIAGEINREQTHEYLEFMNILGQYGYGTAIMLNYNRNKNSSNLQRQILKKRVCGQIDRGLCGLECQYYITHIKDMIYILVINRDKAKLLNSQDILRKVIIDISNYAFESYDIYLDFGIGGVKEYIEDMWQSFATAKIACSKKTYTKRDDEQNEKLHKLVYSVIEGDEVALNQCFQELHEEVINKTQNIESYRLKIYELIVLFKQAIYESAPIQIESMESVFKRLMAIASISEGKECMKDYVVSIFEKIRNQKADKTTVIMDKLITYINSHYNENITLEQLSKMSGFSVFYLSKVFKKHMDMNFSDYLSYLRIKIAKRLLKNPSYSVKSISIEVGYIDPNYFARVFKKYVHMTPTEYRNKNLDF